MAFDLFGALAGLGNIAAPAAAGYMGGLNQAEQVKYQRQQEAMLNALKQAQLDQALKELQLRGEELAWKRQQPGELQLLAAKQLADLDNNLISKPDTMVDLQRMGRDVPIEQQREQLHKVAQIPYQPLFPQAQQVPIAPFGQVPFVGPILQAGLEQQAEGKPSVSYKRELKYSPEYEAGVAYKKAQGAYTGERTQGQILRNIFAPRREETGIGLAEARIGESKARREAIIGGARLAEKKFQEMARQWDAEFKAGRQDAAALQAYRNRMEDRENRLATARIALANAQAAKTKEETEMAKEQLKQLRDSDPILKTLIGNVEDLFDTDMYGDSYPNPAKFDVMIGLLDQTHREAASRLRSLAGRIDTTQSTTGFLAPATPQPTAGGPPVLPAAPGQRAATEQYHWRRPDVQKKALAFAGDQRMVNDAIGAIESGQTGVAVRALAKNKAAQTKLIRLLEILQNIKVSGKY